MNFHYALHPTKQRTPTTVKTPKTEKQILRKKRNGDAAFLLLLRLESGAFPPECYGNPPTHLKEIRTRMKKSTLLCLLLLPALMLFLHACGEDRTIEYRDRTEMNSWLYRTFSENYLFNTSLAAESSLPTYATPENYITRLISSSENRNGEAVSCLFYGAVPLPLTYGLDYDFHSGDSTSYLRVLHVNPGSPAEEAGLKRGDWIVRIDGVPVTSSNSSILEETDEARTHTLTLAQLNDTLHGEPRLTETVTLQLGIPRSLAASPVEKDTVFEVEGKRIGYLLLTNFETDANRSEDFYGEYANQVRTTINRLASQNIEDLVLDLRFAYGHSLNLPYLLGSMLAPAETFGQPFYFLIQNELRGADISLLTSSLVAEGAQLLLPRLYALVSRRTLGGGEMLIHCLKPYMNVTVIGEKTVGYDLQSEIFHNETYGYGLQLVTGEIYNADTTSYSGGITPDVLLEEQDTLLLDMHPLGNPEELLLKRAVRSILYNFGDKDGIELPDTAAQRKED